MRKYLIVIEKAHDNYSAYSPDLLGCVATGRTPEEVTRSMQEAMALHIQGLLEDRLSVPEPRALADYVAVA